MSPLRIAYLLKKFPRLSETFVLNEILHQERSGNEVHVFSRRPADDEPRHPELARLRAIIEPVDVTTKSPWQELFVQAPDNPEFLERFGALVREMVGFGHPRMPGLFAEALYVLRRSRELSIQHVHAHFATDSAIVAMLVSDLGGPSYSVTAHAKDIYRSAVNPRLLARIVERSAFTVTVCDANVEHLSRILPTYAMSRVRRLYNGIDLETFTPRGLERDLDHVLCVGRLVEKKGFDVLVRALALLRDEGVACRATFVGEGDFRPVVEAEIHALGMQDRITMLGARDQDCVRDMLARATVMCLPCRIGDDGNRDALPTTLIESQAMGLPCVSTPVTGIPEILADGHAGLLVPENDPRATAAALRRLFEDAALRTRLAEAGRRQASRLFDARKSAATLAAWFEASACRVAVS